MVRWLVERRLVDVSERLKRARAELDVVDEQFHALADEADDARLRSLVSETPLAEHEHRESRRHAETMGAARSRLTQRIADLERQRDELLDKLGSR